jgi:hypothetical protein
MYPDIWGPAMWHSIFCILEESPDPVPPPHIEFFTLLKDVMPCEKCRIHYTEYIQKNPLPTGREELKAYFWRLRDAIYERNKMN